MITVSTHTVPIHDRQAFWSDVVCAHLVQADCAEVASPLKFEGQIDHWSLGQHPADRAGASVSRIRSQAQRVVRGKRQIAQAQHDHVLVNIQRHGIGVVRQGDRQAVLRPGDLAVYTSDQPYELVFEGAFEQTVVILPAERVRAAVPTLHRHTAETISAGAPMVGALREAAQQVVQGIAPQTHPQAEQALIALLAVVLGERHDAPPVHGLRGTSRLGARIGDETLSARESDVLQLVAKGLTYEDASQLLGISITTVRSHVRSLYAKLGAHNKTEAVFEARQRHWLDW